MPDDAAIQTLAALIGDLREDVVELRGDVQTKFAKIEGAIEVLSAVKSGEHTRLNDRIDTVEHRAKKTEAATNLALEKVEKLSGADGRVASLEATVRSVRSMVVGAAVGAGVTGGGVASLVINVLGGG